VHLIVEGTKKCSFVWRGKTFSGKLTSSGKLHWNDGEVWVRCPSDPQASSTVHTNKRPNADNMAQEHKKRLIDVLTSEVSSAG